MLMLSAAMSDSDSGAEAPVADPRFPLTVIYCGICGVPPEYCPYGPDWERCRVWIESNHPDLMPIEARLGKTVTGPVDASADAAASKDNCGLSETESESGEEGVDGEMDEAAAAEVCAMGLVILLVFDFCDNSMREKDWRCRKRGMQAA